MGDLIFFIKMIIYTLVLVVLLQVKVGSSTLEERVIGLTHQSALGAQLQDAGENVSHFITRTYRKWRGGSKSSLNMLSDEQIPGKRLRAKIEKWRNDVQEKIESETKSED